MHIRSKKSLLSPTKMCEPSQAFSHWGVWYVATGGFGGITSSTLLCPEKIQVKLGGYIVKIQVIKSYVKLVH